MDVLPDFPFAEEGYESDTGARDIPTRADFESHRPVTVHFVRVKIRGGSTKVLNRQGRAICRLFSARGWSPKAIAYIFRVSEASVSRAIQNRRYNPRDREQDDLKLAGPDFSGDLPPPLSDARLKALIAGAIPVVPKASTRTVICLDTSDDEFEPDAGPLSNGRSQRATKLKCNIRLREIADNEDNENGSVQENTQPNSGPSPYAQTNPHAPAPRFFPPPPLFRPIPLPPVRRSEAPPPELSAFLKTLTGADFSPYYELLKAQGFTVPLLHTIATWADHEIYREDGLNGLLMGNPLGQRGMTALIFIKFQKAISTLQSTSHPPPPAPSLPPLNSGATLSDFLKNVMGADLSHHLALFQAQGYDIPALHELISDTTEARRVLRVTLLDPARLDATEVSLVPPTGKQGISPLEVLALELCFKRAAIEARAGQALVD
ncbi:hypothetical protein K438DRAFT_1827465 [Mycena galopus ATCC 62051]|nr:hypothetical protein K438DRAFT_1827465 [Mycena galopus ATCC 62051]